MKAEWPTSVIEKSTNAFVPAKYQLDMAHPCEEINPALQDVKVDFIGEYKKMGCDGGSANNKKAVVGREVPREQDRGLFSARAGAGAGLRGYDAGVADSYLESPVLPRVQTPPRSLGSRRSSVDDEEKLPASRRKVLTSGRCCR